MNKKNVPIDTHAIPTPIPSLNMDYIDPCGVWKPSNDKQDELSFDSWAAIKFALIFGRLAFISHQRGTHRMVAGLGVGIALILLFLFWFASRWHAGD